MRIRNTDQQVGSLGHLFGRHLLVSEILEVFHQVLPGQQGLHGVPRRSCSPDQITNNFFKIISVEKFYKYFARITVINIDTLKA